MLREQEKQDVLAAVELLRQVALASYDEANADRPLPTDGSAPYGPQGAATTNRLRSDVGNVAKPL